MADTNNKQGSDELEYAKRIRSFLLKKGSPNLDKGNSHGMIEAERHNN